MAFVTRSPRHISEPIVHPTTSTGVGPGTYSPARIFDNSSHRINCVPFGNGAIRRLDCSYFHDDVGPAPGAYLSISKTSKKESARWNAFRSTTARFRDERDTRARAVPDPGAYLGHRAWSKKEEVRPRIKMSRLASLSWRNSSVPSIPVRVQSFGYQVDSKGFLFNRQQPRQNMIQTNIPSEIHCVRTTDFGRTSCRPASLPKTDGPGPQKYSPRPMSDITSDKSMITRPSAVFSSKCRSRETKLTKIDQPPMLLSHVSWSLNSSPRRFQDFGNRCSRKLTNSLEVDDEDMTPGPGSYQINHSPQYFRLTPKNRIAFGQASSRFIDSHELSPGPQTYDSGSLFASTKGQRTTRADQRHPFMRSTKRFSVDTTDGPGPGQYDIVKAMKASSQMSQARTTQFSKSPRELYTTQKTDVPSPGAYTLPSSLNEYNKKHSSAFASTTQRFRRDLQRESMPGPAHYTQQNCVEHSASTIRPLLYTTDRFNVLGNTNSGPAPGDYSVRHSMVHKTFNVTIDPNFDRFVP